MDRTSDSRRPTAAATLAEIADLAYFRVDDRRNVVEMSPAMERLTGFRADDAIGRSCLTIHRCEECLGGCGVFDAHTVLDRYLELYRADGSTIRVRKSGRVLLDEAGRITGAIEVVRPMTPSEAAAPTARNDDEADVAGETMAHRTVATVVDMQPGRAVTPAAEAARAEIDAIRSALIETRYRRTEAARALGMSRTTLWRKMREYGL